MLARFRTTSPRVHRCGAVPRRRRAGQGSRGLWSLTVAWPRPRRAASRGRGRETGAGPGRGGAGRPPSFPAAGFLHPRASPERPAQFRHGAACSSKPLTGASLIPEKLFCPLLSALSIQSARAAFGQLLVEIRLGGLAHSDVCWCSLEVSPAPGPFLWLRRQWGWLLDLLGEKPPDSRAVSAGKASRTRASGEDSRLDLKMEAREASHTFKLISVISARPHWPVSQTQVATPVSVPALGEWPFSRCGAAGHRLKPVGLNVSALDG